MNEGAPVACRSAAIRRFVTEPIRADDGNDFTPTPTGDPMITAAALIPLSSLTVWLSAYRSRTFTPT